MAEVVHRTGYDWSYIWRVMKGIVRPSLQAAKLIADAKGVTIDELYEELRPLWKQGSRRLDARELGLATRDP